VEDTKWTAPEITPPSWVDIAGYAFEKIHSNVLVRALNGGKPEARKLAAKMWARASGETIDVDAVCATTEYRLGRGRHSVVDFLVDIRSGGKRHRLGVEVKVDGAPNAIQFKAMEAKLSGEHKRLVLLAFGAAQVCNYEYSGRELCAQKLWNVRDIIEMSELIEGASPCPDVARGWLAELQNEDRRRLSPFTNDSLGWGGRVRAKRAYQYAQVAKAIRGVDGVRTRISIQPFGVVMTLVARPIKSVTVYLEFVNGVVAVKAGANAEAVNARKSTLAVADKIRTQMAAAGIVASRARRKKGKWVTLLWLDSKEVTWSLEHLTERAKSALAVWAKLDWPDGT